MKRIIYSVLVLLTVLSLSITSCKKKEDPKPAEPTIEGKWGLIASTWTTDGVTTDAFAAGFAELCEKNSITEFRAGGVFVYTDACDGNKQFTATWSYNKDTKLLTVTTSDESDVYQVKELSATTLVIEIVSDGTTYRNTYARR